MPEIEVKEYTGNCDLCQFNGPLMDDGVVLRCKDETNCYSRDVAWRAGLQQGIGQEFHACCKVICSYCREGLPFWPELAKAGSYCHKTKTGKLLPCKAEALHQQKGKYNGC